MNIRTAFSALLFLTFLAFSACALPTNPHWFPRARPLFAGLDEGKVRPSARAALAEAKVDFQLARHDKALRYAKYVSTIPYTNSRVYQGKGYRLTIVHKDLGVSHSDGPDILLDASITGGKPFSYDEIDEVVD
jgi:hypothetical protein